MPGNPEIMVLFIEVACASSLALGIITHAIIRGLKNFSNYEKSIRAEVGEEQP